MSWSCTCEVHSNISAGTALWDHIRSYIGWKLWKNNQYSLFSHKYFKISQYPSAEGNTKLGGVADTSVGCAVIQRDLDRLEKCVNRSLMQLTRGITNSCPGGGTTPGTGTVWVSDHLQQMCTGRTWGPWWTPGCPRTSHVPSWQRRHLTPWAALGRAVPAWEEMVFPLHSALMRQICGAVSSTGLLVYKRYGYRGMSSRQGED